MFCDKSPDLQPPDYESTERLLAEEEGHLWTGDDDDDFCITTATVFLQFIALAMVFLVGTLFGFFWRGDLDGLCGPHVSRYSPLVDEISVKYHPKSFNGAFLKENIFRQDASPDVDAAWDSLGVNFRDVRVPETDAGKSGLALDQVKIKDKYGGGYPAKVEGFQHLHCLNVLRQGLYYNYDYYHSQGHGVFSTNDYIARRQVSYCLDVLRQQLMCTVDTGVVGQVWMYPENPEPQADLNTRHKCKNFNDIRKWAEDNQLPENPPDDFLQQPGPGDLIYKRMP
ncbi:uncharacterized protein N7469_001489 [Penicillium citrinum]|uniref:Tat pathway signal sequence n=1 Tax=Penicillium citrinum TaxID=5077 RepID=A0A9W9PG57_PENCI|nr:uncharacterized protein N7469_001489 [Penicillium citrinum]KAJ5243162.1 hypothetical protein N7469_001489 [Penicillium citrinum]